MKNERDLITAAAGHIVRWAEATGQDAWDLPTALEAELVERAYAETSLWLRYGAPANSRGLNPEGLREAVWEAVGRA